MNLPKLLIDGNALTWKARYALGELSTEIMTTGSIFGFLEQIRRIATDFDNSGVVYCWDSKKSHREKLFPAYKEKRRTIKLERTPEEVEEDNLFYAQMDLLHDYVLPKIGYKNNYKHSGFEGDDLIASIVYANPEVDFIIATGDEDMYQLLGPGVSIRKSRKNARGKKEYYLYTEEMFTAEYGITPAQWIEVKALAGCRSDEVPGIRGVGEDTAVKYLKGGMTPNMKRYQDITSPEGKAVRKRNLDLVSLPFKNCPEIVLEHEPSLSLKGFIDICNEYEFQYFLHKENLEKWKKLLNLR